MAEFVEKYISADEELALKYYRDLKNSFDTAREEGEIEGILKGKLEGEIEGIYKGKLEVARNMLSLGISIETIIQATGLSEEEINHLRDN